MNNTYPARREKVVFSKRDFVKSLGGRIQNHKYATKSLRALESKNQKHFSNYALPMIYGLMILTHSKYTPEALRTTLPAN